MNKLNSFEELSPSQLQILERLQGIGRVPQPGTLPSEQPQINEETANNGALGWFKDSADAGFASALGGMARFGEEFSPVGKGILGDFADSMDEVARRNSPQAGQELTGLNYVAGAVGNAVGSMAGSMLPTLPLMFIPGGQAAGVARSASLISKLWSSPFGRFIATNVASSPVEALSEAGNLITQMREEGYTNDEIRTAALKSAALNTAWLTVANAVEGGALAKITGHIGASAAKKAAERTLKDYALMGLKGAVTDSIGEGAEEYGQSLIGDYSAGKPFDYANAKESAIQGAIGGAFLGGVGGVIGGAMSKGSNDATNPTDPTNSSVAQPNLPALPPGGNGNPADINRETLYDFATDETKQLTGEQRLLLTEAAKSGTDDQVIGLLQQYGLTPAQEQQTSTPMNAIDEATQQANAAVDAVINPQDKVQLPNTQQQGGSPATNATGEAPILNGGTTQQTSQPTTSQPTTTQTTQSVQPTQPARPTGNGNTWTNLQRNTLNDLQAIAAKNPQYSLFDKNGTLDNNELIRLIKENYPAEAIDSANRIYESAVQGDLQSRRTFAENIDPAMRAFTMLMRDANEQWQNVVANSVLDDTTTEQNVADTSTPTQTDVQQTEQSQSNPQENANTQYNQGLGVTSNRGTHITNVFDKAPDSLVNGYNYEALDDDTLAELEDNFINKDSDEDSINPIDAIRYTNDLGNSITIYSYNDGSYTVADNDGNIVSEGYSLKDAIGLANDVIQDYTDGLEGVENETNQGTNAEPQQIEETETDNEEQGQSNQTQVNTSSKNRQIAEALVGFMRDKGIDVIAGNDNIIKFFKDTKFNDVVNAESTEDSSIKITFKSGETVDFEGGSYGDNNALLITDKGLTTDTTVHEYTHLWNKLIQKENPKLWNEIISTLKATPMWNEISNDEYYKAVHKGDENRIADEVLAQLSGKNANDIFKQWKDEGAPNKIIYQVKMVLNKYWDAIKKLICDEFGIPQSADLNTVLNMPLADLLGVTDNLDAFKGKTFESKGCKAGYELSTDGTVVKFPKDSPYMLAHYWEMDKNKHTGVVRIFYKDKLNTNGEKERTFHDWLTTTSDLPLAEIKQKLKDIAANGYNEPTNVITNEEDEDITDVVANTNEPQSEPTDTHRYMTSGFKAGYSLRDDGKVLKFPEDSAFSTAEIVGGGRYTYRIELTYADKVPGVEDDGYTGWVSADKNEVYDKLKEWATKGYEPRDAYGGGHGEHDIYKGGYADVRIDDGSKIRFQYKIADLADLIASNSVDGKVNPDYPKRLQPRDRSSVAMMQQVNNIANTLDAERLGADNSINSGAPIVYDYNLTQKVVLNGNGRVMAIRKALGNKDSTGKTKYDQYKDWLRDHAQDFGINPLALKGYKFPVLVRVVSNKEDFSKIIESTTGGAETSASEQAKMDAKKITEATLSEYVSNVDGDVLSASNYDFAMSVLKDITGNKAEKLNPLLQKDGGISQEGRNRIVNALFTMAYNDDNLLNKLSMEADPNNENILNALRKLAPLVAKQNLQIKRGHLFDADFITPLVKAINTYNNIKAQGKSVEQFLQENETVMFKTENDDIADVEKKLLEFLGEKRQSEKKIYNLIKSMIDSLEMRGDPDQGNLLGEQVADVTGETIINDVLNALNTPNIFDQIATESINNSDKYILNDKGKRARDMFVIKLREGGAKDFFDDKTIDAASTLMGFRAQTWSSIMAKVYKVKFDEADFVDRFTFEFKKIRDPKKKDAANIASSDGYNILNPNFSKISNYTIKAFVFSNEESLFHELGHSMMWDLLKMANKKGIPNQLREDLKELITFCHGKYTLDNAGNFTSIELSDEKFAQAIPKLLANPNNVKQNTLKTVLKEIAARLRKLVNGTIEYYNNLIARQPRSQKAKVYDMGFEIPQKVMDAMNRIIYFDGDENDVFVGDSNSDSALKKLDSFIIPKKTDTSFGKTQHFVDEVDLKTVDDVRSKYAGTKEWMKAPNGEKSNLNQRQWCQVRTKAFKDWFGDWENDPENASKAIDENGEPKVFYHGTGAEFTVFDKESVGKEFSNLAQDYLGFYFTDSKIVADDYAFNSAAGIKLNELEKVYGSRYDEDGNRNEELFKEYDKWFEKENNNKNSKVKKVMPVFLNVRKPYETSLHAFRKWDGWSNVYLYRQNSTKGINGFGDEIWDYDYNKIAQQRGKWVKDRIAKKNDGAIITNYDFDPKGEKYSEYGKQVVIAFEPNQVKSATNKNGDFSSFQDDINLKIIPKPMLAMNKRSNMPNVFYNYSGSKTARSKYGVGKDISSKIYVHKDYVDDAIDGIVADGLIPKDAYKKALAKLKQFDPNFKFNTVSIQYKDTYKDQKVVDKAGTISFQETPGFDTEREPFVGRTAKITPDGDVTIDNKSAGKIYHHKWQWVKDDYKGFDVDESKAWTEWWYSQLQASAQGNSIETWNNQLFLHGMPEDADGWQNSETNKHWSSLVKENHSKFEDWKKTLKDAQEYTEKLEKEAKANGIVDSDSDKTETGSGGTQVTKTTGTYIRAASWVLDVNPSTKSILDYGAGKGEGSNAIRKYISNIKNRDDVTVDTFELNASNWNPTYTRESDINRKYDSIICLNVLNVVQNVPGQIKAYGKDGIRDHIVKNIARLLTDDGVAIIGTRSWYDDIAYNTNYILSDEEKGMFVLKGKNDKYKVSYQKGFDGDELLDYVQNLLGDEYIVKKLGSVPGDFKYNENTGILKGESKGTICKNGIIITKNPDFKYLTPSEKTKQIKRGFQDAIQLKVTGGTLYSGAGTIDIALNHLVDHQYAIEYSGKIAAVYKMNNGEKIFIGNINSIMAQKYLRQHAKEAVYLHASPPCCDYSKAKTNRDRKGLLDYKSDYNLAKRVAWQIKRAKPKIFTLENVEGYILDRSELAKKYDAIGVILDALREDYYFDNPFNADGTPNHDFIYNAKDYGSLVDRKRLLLRAIRKDVGKLPPKPQQVHATNDWYDLIKDHIKDLPRPTDSGRTSYTVSPYLLERLNDAGIDPFNVDVPTLLVGGGKFGGKKDGEEFKSGGVRVARQGEFVPSLCASDHEQKIFLPGGDIRVATPKIMAMIMGLGEDFKLPKSKAIGYRVVGNGVPVQLTQNVFGPLVELIDDEKNAKDVIDFKVVKSRKNTIQTKADNKIKALKKELKDKLNEAYDRGANNVELASILNKYNDDVAKALGERATEMKERAKIRSAELRDLREQLKTGAIDSFTIKGATVSLDADGKEIITKIDDGLPGRTYVNKRTQGKTYSNPVEAMGDVISNPDAPKGMASSCVDWLKKVHDKFYERWVDKYDPIYRIFDKAVMRVTGKKLKNAKTMRTKMQLIQNNAGGALYSMISGDIESAKIVQKQYHLPFLSTMRMVMERLDSVAKLPAVKKFVEMMPKGKQTPTEALQTLIVAQGVQEDYKNYINDFQYKLAEWEKNGKKGKKPDFNEYLKGYKFPGGFDAKTINDVIKVAPAELKQVAEMYYQYNRNLLALMEHGDLITKEEADAYRERYHYYCPLMRDFSDTEPVEDYVRSLIKGQGMVNVSSPIKHRHGYGSARNVISPFKSTAQATASILMRVERNRVGKDFVRTAEQYKLTDLCKRVKGETSDSKNSIVTVMFEGKKQSYWVHPELYPSVTNTFDSTTKLEIAPAILVAKILREGSTRSPSFCLRNFFRDTVDASISTEGFIPVYDSIRGLYKLKTDKEFRAAFMNAGITSSYMFNNAEDTYHKLEEMAGGKIEPHGFDALWAALKKYSGWDLLGEISEDIEASTRAGLFLVAKEKGLDAQEMIFQAVHGATNFGRSGISGKEWNKIVPFFNATIQGVDKLYGQFKDDFQGTMWRIGKWIIAPSMLLWALNKDEDWYKELDPAIKATCWCLPGGIRIPKPQESGVLFGTGVEAMLDYAYRNDTSGMKNWIRQMKDNAVPNVIPTIILPLLEWQANYSYFRGKQVVSNSMLKLPGEMQYGSYTSTTAIALGRTTGQSPAKIDNAWRSITGTMGSLAFQIPDLFSVEKQGLPEKYLTEMPIFRDFFINDMNLVRSKNDMYALKEAATKERYKLNKITPEYTEINRAANMLNKAYAKIREIRDMPAEKMDSVTKRQKINKINEDIKRISTKMLLKYRDKYNI